MAFLRPGSQIHRVFCFSFFPQFPCIIIPTRKLRFFSLRPNERSFPNENGVFFFLSLYCFPPKLTKYLLPTVPFGLPKKKNATPKHKRGGDVVQSPPERHTSSLNLSPRYPGMGFFGGHFGQSKCDETSNMPPLDGIFFRNFLIKFYC